MSLESEVQGRTTRYAQDLKRCPNTDLVDQYFNDDLKALARKHSVNVAEATSIANDYLAGERDV